MLLKTEANCILYCVLLFRSIFGNLRKHSTYSITIKILNLLVSCTQNQAVCSVFAQGDQELGQSNNNNCHS